MLCFRSQVAKPVQKFAETAIYEGFRPIFVIFRSLGVHYCYIAGADLFDELPQQGRHAAHVDQAQQRMVSRTGDLVALGGADGVGLMLAGVKQSIRDNGIAVTIQDFQVDDVVAVGFRTRDDVADAHRFALRQRTRASPVMQYRIAAGGSLPGEPKLPWPSTNG